MNKSFVGLVLAAGSIFALALGIRSAQPLFISSINSATGIGYATISLAFAVAQIVWGIAQPVAGGIGDRWGPRPVMLAGAVFLALGTALTAMAQTPLALTLAIGVVAAAGAGAFGPAQLASAVSKWIPEAKRSVANGIIGAGGSFGQFVIVPLAQLSIGLAGWQPGLVIVGVMGLIAIPLVFYITDTSSVPAHAHAQAGTLSQADVIKALDHAEISQGPGGPAAMVPGQHHVRMHMFIGQARGGRFEVVETLGAIDPQERLVGSPALTP